VETSAASSQANQGNSQAGQSYNAQGALNASATGVAAASSGV